jgi:hypothetical protein
VIELYSGFKFFAFKFNVYRYTEAAEWRSKVVVDKLQVSTLLPQREKPGQTDRYHSLLHTSPKKLGVTGKFVKGSEVPAPVSMYLDEVGLYKLRSVDP